MDGVAIRMSCHHTLGITAMRLVVAASLFVATLSLPLHALAGYAGGRIDLAVSVTKPRQHVFYVAEKIPVAPGPLTLYYPKWIPGEHGPDGPLGNVAGLFFEADGKALAWHRDPVDMFAFHLDVPQGVSILTANFELLPSRGNVSLTPQMVVLEWNQVALYPAGLPTAKIEIQPRITLPSGWRYATALDTAFHSGKHLHICAGQLQQSGGFAVDGGRIFPRTGSVARQSRPSLPGHGGGRSGGSCDHAG